VGHVQTQFVLWSPTTTAQIVDDGSHVVQYPRFPVCQQSASSQSPCYAISDTSGHIGVRHACEQGDGLDGYTWTVFDAREGGVQVIKDGKNNLKITTEFLKVPGGEHGGSWAARIKGEPMDPCTC
jgi:mannosyl-oligosaccharide glucosidase